MGFYVFDSTFMFLNDTNIFIVIFICLFIFVAVPYEKGFTFLFYLEGLVGESLMNSFMRAYVEKYKVGNKITVSNFEIS